VNQPPVEVSRRAMRQFFPGRRIDSYIRPLPEHGVVYVKNPKAACSTILVWLDRIHTGDHEQVFTNVHKEHRLPRVREVGWPRVVEMLSGSAYRFSFVRHPLRRFESVYWDKIVHKARCLPEVQRFLGLPEDRTAPLTFEQFLGAVEQQDPITEMNRHWQPQHVSLMHPLVSYDFIGRLENFDADLERVREEAGLPRVPLQVRNASRHRGGDSVYDGRPDLVRRVEELYAKDFETYGY
jgi:hypothetical protein